MTQKLARRIKWAIVGYLVGKRSAIYNTEILGTDIKLAPGGTRISKSLIKFTGVQLHPGDSLIGDRSKRNR